MIKYAFDNTSSVKTSVVTLEFPCNYVILSNCRRIFGTKHTLSTLNKSQIAYGGLNKSCQLLFACHISDFTNRIPNLNPHTFYMY